ncbi:organic hydroperoxide resistance transcriptional regulator [Clostridium acetireducens DSM 10703]|jgi:DNA-binding MarR family transcriptional regulator|uniref:Organic hydroperoxide resistance transcriptional regulator n=1 Tax=Clostridium acetireducens DSM 10703 TaxID=1121290 RepID=A0A1E8F042_9CLOT|nr:MarR family transcriptional regulator [Clostridium acetireducens]OFI06777.1 organic hydroperoxide resistance transcriptional regulator [Clostridium acetireducens DSM 10703]
MNCEFDKWVGYWIKIIFRNITNLHNKNLEKYNITNSQIAVLAILWREDGLTQKEIGDKIQIRPASLTGLVNSLLDKKLILRKLDEKDARNKRLYLTEEGAKLKSVSLEIINKLEETLVKGFSKEEKQLLIYWLKKIYNNLGT